MSKVIGFLKGKKSYLVGLAVVGWGLYQHFFGPQMSWVDTVNWILGGTGLMTVRAAIAKVGIEAK